MGAVFERHMNHGVEKFFYWVMLGLERARLILCFVGCWPFWKVWDVLTVLTFLICWVISFLYVLPLEAWGPVQAAFAPLMIVKCSHFRLMIDCKNGIICKTNGIGIQLEERYNDDELAATLRQGDSWRWCGRCRSGCCKGWGWVIFS